MDDDRPIHDGHCHCGAIKFRVRLIDEFRTASRCACSLCRMRGAVVVSAWVGDLDIVQGEDRLTLYQFHTHTARHYFCKICGIYTHHQRRSDPRQYGVNVACIAGMSPFDFLEVRVADGKFAAPETAGSGKLAGVLRFEPAY